MGNLTTLEAKNLIKPGNHGDGDGLYLRVAKAKAGKEPARSWLFRYKVGKKTTWLGLGGYPEIGLSDARTKAQAAKKAIIAGRDPLAEKKAEKAERETAKARTFEAVAEMFIVAHAPKWRGPKQAPQWRASLKRYAYPVIGNEPVAQINPEKVLSVLTPIWNTKTETASRIRSRIENVLDFAAAQGWISGENPARWRGRLQYALPAPEKVQPVVHYPAVPWADLPAVMTKLAASRGTAALCLRFSTLTGARSAEGRGARWNEIDVAEKVWTVPPERMKAGKLHRVPLSDAAIAVLRATLLPGASWPTEGLVFAGGKAGAPLSDVSVSKALRVAGAGAFTVHGMRSTFRDWAAEQTGYPREIAEAALAHANRDKVEAAYRRSDLFDQRARLMRDWAEFCTGKAVGGDNVRQLHTAR